MSVQLTTNVNILALSSGQDSYHGGGVSECAVDNERYHFGFDGDQLLITGTTSVNILALYRGDQLLIMGEGE